MDTGTIVTIVMGSISIVLLLFVLYLLRRVYSVTKRERKEAPGSKQETQ